MSKKDTVKETTILSDEQIVELYWNRDEKAIEMTDRKYHRYLYSLAYNVLHDDMDCEECLNDTYLGTWNKIPPSRPKWFQAFVAKITRNLALKKYRDERIERRIPSELTVSLDEFNECLAYEPSAEEDYHTRRVSEILTNYLRTLTDRQEYVFVCRYYCSDSVANIAEMLAISTSTVFRDLGEIRDGLKKALEEAGYGDAE